jgi:uncharacterized membrane protein YfcA
VKELSTAVGIGLVSGVLSGAFGIGGGIITTPAIRLLLGAPALIAVGTPLPVIFPSAITGAVNYHRRGLLDVRASITCALAGSVFAVLGAVATQWVGGTVVLLLTAALIFYTAADMLAQVLRPPRLGLEASEERDAFEPPAEDAEGEGGGAARSYAAAQPPADAPRVRLSTAPPSSPAPPAHPAWKLAAIGALTGAYSGFLGLGGGFVLVPLLTRWLGFDIKRAIGTSLATIAILAVPGTIAHAVLGHVDWAMAGALAIGVIPGAWAGSRITLGASDRVVRIGFAAMLLIVGSWLAAGEMGWLPK